MKSSKKTVVSAFIMAAYMMAGSAMAAQCPSASSFNNMHLFAVNPADGHQVWVGFEGSTLKVTSTEQNKSYQDTMKSATARRLHCAGVPSSVTLCAYSGPHLTKTLGCSYFLATNQEAEDMPAGTAFAMLDPSMVGLDTPAATS